MCEFTGTQHVLLSDIPNLIRRFPQKMTVHILYGNILQHAEHHTSFSNFVYDNLGEDKERFAIKTANYEIEYFTWKRSPYLIKHNGKLEFWLDKNGYPKIEEFERVRCQEQANEIISLIYEIVIPQQMSATTW